ncbi:hypothetical protein [Streptomyces sp. ISL-44]|nr:hypothetical protein [Streptomyces sp. ISL-44]
MAWVTGWQGCRPAMLAARMRAEPALWQARPPDAAMVLRRYPIQAAGGQQ